MGQTAALEKESIFIKRYISLNEMDFSYQIKLRFPTRERSNVWKYVDQIVHSNIWDFSEKKKPNVYQ